MCFCLKAGSWLYPKAGSDTFATGFFCCVLLLHARGVGVLRRLVPCGRYKT
ncbi:hypothetical protein HMPREF9248_0470, partial [Fannyhessea vaginae PB189-T1-4]